MRWRNFCEFTVYLNINHRIDKRHCMLHLHTCNFILCVQAGCTLWKCRFVGIQSRWRFLFVPESVWWAKWMHLCMTETILPWKQPFGTSKWWTMGIQAAMCTNILSIGSDLYSSPTQQTNWRIHIRFRPCKHQDKVVSSWTMSFQNGFSAQE